MPKFKNTFNRPTARLKIILKRLKRLTVAKQDSLQTAS